VWNYTLGIDRAVSAWLATHLTSPLVQWPLVLLTMLGVGGIVWFALVACGWALAPRLARSRDASSDPNLARAEVLALRGALWRAALAVVLSLTFADCVVKPLVARERPFVHGPPLSSIVLQPTTLSFPSGHAASAAAGALALARAWPPAALPLAILAGGIAFSRIALGVHFVGDVMGGLLLGLFMAALAAPPSARAREDRSVLPPDRP